MHALNLIQRINEIVTGDGFLREVELPLHGCIRASDDYLPLVTGDAPTWAANGISFADGEQATIEFVVPMDYEVAADLCALRLVVVPSADAAHTTDIGLTTAQSRFRNGAAVDATAVSAVAEDATASTSALVREVILDISGNSYQPGDRVRRTIDVNGSGATELILVGVALVYSGNLAAHNDDDRNRDLG